MASKKFIMRVSYPGLGESPFKTVAFSQSMTVEEACEICASKGGLKDKIDEYGLSIKDSGTWLKAGDTLDKYPLQNCAGLEYKPTPKKTTVVYEGEEKKMDIDFSLLGSDVLALILEALGEPKSNEFGFSLISETDGLKGPSVDYQKPLIDQANPSNTKIVVKKKSKIGGIFRRTDSHKSRRESSFVTNATPSSTSRIFGVPLAQVSHPAKYGGLPAVVAKTIEFLEDTSLQLEGIFRISGNQSEVLAMKKAFDDGIDVNVRDCSSPHCAAGLLKLYLRDLPEPVFTFSFYEIFIALYGTVTNEAVRVTYYKIIVDALPTPNRLLLFRILPFLANVVKYAEVNKMAIHNVATVFGPNILRSADNSAMAMIQGTAAVNAITCDMIQNYEEIVENAENEDFISVAIALYKYEGKSETEVSFGEGAVVFVTKEDTAGWWEGEVNGEFGFFPANYVRPVLQLQKEPEKPVAKPKPKAADPVEKDTSAKQASSSPAAASSSAVAAEVKSKIEVKSEPKKQRPNPRASGAGGGSKQKFMAELEDLKTAAIQEAMKNASLETLVNNMALELEELKKSGGAQSSAGTGGDLKATVTSLRGEVKALVESNSKLSKELAQTTTSLGDMKKQLDGLKQQEIELKRDLKIVQFKCDKLTDTGEKVRRPPPSINRP
mmetsp:Transcript_110592/g.165586  ORF Transcript_110592/g.165586 Transcript_110592/m.165586 type:complete len:663 (-) Transcript_110592:120-2108(-)|eukprot:CAMPEP_0117032450 /NCGR_PEP_ID=MMETSP0472-20121206/23259_1 /TAXON_ID=693140 ORGANISM="Tiarina fusus, Strain LIS" /NCGR_SAMPLE_ID=MMETSP0472 /ASSEMBLY_ACC=CAM_ASM_000603 /LENGTH=662 /DNA_ID=CAMNT_0004741089 /DNA_START=83 /DNA_END=2071 /DNA_ORIENTATION=+